MQPCTEPLRCVADSTDTGYVSLFNDTNATGVPVMRWIFMRRNEHVHCELSPDGFERLYELRLRRAGGNESVEHYSDVADAFARQVQVERWLIEDGWNLEHYEKFRRPVTLPPPGLTERRHSL